MMTDFLLPECLLQVSPLKSSYYYIKQNFIVGKDKLYRVANQKLLCC